MKSLLIEVKVVNSIAAFQMSQHYVNKEHNAIETVFLFPVDIEYAISKVQVEFLIESGERKSLETIIDERKKLEYRFEDSVASGKTEVFGALSKTQKDMMKISIGNFPARSEAILKVHYYQLLPVEDLIYCLRVPVTYIPRYVGNIDSFIKTGAGLKECRVPNCQNCNSKSKNNKSRTSSPALWSQSSLAYGTSGSTSKQLERSLFCAQGVT